jgi:putative Mg2+ transporter-C (MgtC) family protein
MGILEFVTRLGLAILLGSMIGFERQWQQKSAGLRTNTLVALGSAAYILLSVSIKGITADPTRIASQIVTGIGFLGAGVIMKHGLTVQGLNTAATIWCSAAVGSLAGFGLYIQAIITAFTVIISHLVLRPIGRKISRLPMVKPGDSQHQYLLIVKSKEEVENHIRALLLMHFSHDNSLLMRSLRSIDEGDSSTIAVIMADILTIGRQDLKIENIVSSLTIEKGVTEVSWELGGIENDV